MNIFQELKPPTVIYETDSSYNGHIKVVDVGSTRKIIVDGITQSLNWNSPSCKKQYWGKVIELLQETSPTLKKIMILGLGGGTLIPLLTNTFNQIDITTVEIDPVMVDIANKFFGISAYANNHTIVEDALKVVVEPDKYGLQEYNFQALLVDIYNGETFPDLGKSGNFISAIKKLVVPGGLIIFNRIYLEHHQDDVNHFLKYVSDNLKNVESRVVAGYTNSDNILIYGRS